MNDEEIQEDEGLIDRIKESPRTVSALIIILIVAAAIYAFSGDETEQAGQLGETDEQARTTEQEQEETTTEEQEEEETNTEQANTTEGEQEDPKESQVAGGNSNQQQEGTEEQVEIPEPSRTEEGFVEVAQPGNGITHLARRASSRWLSENQTDFAVTDEHRIFIEDYIQNKLGTQELAIGETVEIDNDLIQEAVQASQDLSEQQLQNLSQYTHVLQ